MKQSPREDIATDELRGVRRLASIIMVAITVVIYIVALIVSQSRQ